MSSITWTPRAVASEARPWQGCAWRVVEAQHVASTMKLVDDAAEQDLLEDLLESSKPALPDVTRALHYLLQAPFRYPAPPGGSRFRGPNDSGVFYGAETIRTACAELGYWRWRFLQESENLLQLPPVAHTAFRVAIDAQMVDLRLAPFNRDADCWTHRSDYAATQAFGRVARDADVEAILYTSVRDPQAAWCVAVLTHQALAVSDSAASQTWWLEVRQQGVAWRRDRGRSYMFGEVHWI